MPDFTRDFGANAPFVEDLFLLWTSDPRAVSEDWASFFVELPGPGTAAGRLALAPPGKATPPAEGAGGAAPSANPSATSESTTGRAEPLRGVAGKIVQNMEASLEIPTATSVRTLPVKLLEENRALLNRHLVVMGMPKASFTHIIAFALVRVLKRMPGLNASFELRGAAPCRIHKDEINLGVAIDLEGKNGTRSLVVPNLKNAGAHDFAAFLKAYSALIDRARKGKLEPKDFADTTVTLTNPGTIGTFASVPRLMPGQGLILATGAIGWPTGYAFAAPEVMTELGISKVMTMTSTYDHRVIQGAESGQLLADLDGLLQADQGFYDELFASTQCPYLPYHPARDANPAVLANGAFQAIEKQARVLELINAYRASGSRVADLDPLEFVPKRPAELSLEHYGLSIWDLDRQFITGGLGGKNQASLREILDTLQETYCRKIGAEYMHLSEPEEKRWLQDRMEGQRNLESFSPTEQQQILNKLNAAEAFERFLHTRYLGHKRFSLEGAESLIPALDELLNRAAAAQIGHVVIGMAHRGRLNVLVNTLNKPYEKVFTEFEGLVDPNSVQGSGDVKYHLGSKGEHQDPQGRKLTMTLASNPSHLEAVNPVVEGITRAMQVTIEGGGHDRVLPVPIHGDAALAGQGVVAETLNMCQLPGYSTGGTVHIIVNNQIGYTAGPKETRSTYFCTDMAKSVEAPILHVNGDYPESVLRAIRVAFDYRQKFHHDVVVDIVCYRRWGHNETDEPAYTQPLLYQKIARQVPVRERYGRLLVQRQHMTEEARAAAVAAFEAHLKNALDIVRSVPAPPPRGIPPLDAEDPRDLDRTPGPETGVPAATVRHIVSVATTPPPGHTVHPNLARQLQRRVEMADGAAPVDFGAAEAMAFGSLLLQGIPVRLSGQDCGRGTFSHRHSVLRDQRDGKDFLPPNHLGAGQAKFEVYDSLLSEEAALAFEYGYATTAQNALVLWEAQFGDFVNGAQIAIDQFLAASEVKWNLRSGVVLLLPHGYDGQGPEHSSARLERFLQLCAEGNITVANCSSAVQFFHLLRRQGMAAEKRPLVVMTPKSLLKRKEAGSKVSAFVDGRFESVLDDPRVQNPAAARAVLLCSGKVYYDLDDHRAEHRLADTAVVRLEQLYPFPKARLGSILARYSAAKTSLTWVQEEPRNQGAWSFMAPRLAEMGYSARYVGRRPAASPATGSLRTHQLEQEWIVSTAFAERRANS